MTGYITCLVVGAIVGAWLMGLGAEEEIKKARAEKDAILRHLKNAVKA